jgi:hypothetical protein
LEEIGTQTSQERGAKRCAKELMGRVLGFCRLLNCGLSHLSQLWVRSPDRNTVCLLTV